MLKTQEEIQDKHDEIATMAMKSTSTQDTIHLLIAQCSLTQAIQLCRIADALEAKPDDRDALLRECRRTIGEVMTMQVDHLASQSQRAEDWSRGVRGCQDVLRALHDKLGEALDED